MSQLSMLPALPVAVGSGLLADQAGAMIIQPGLLDRSGVGLRPDHEMSPGHHNACITQHAHQHIIIALPLIMGSILKQIGAKATQWIHPRANPSVLTPDTGSGC